MGERGIEGVGSLLGHRRLPEKEFGRSEGEIGCSVVKMEMVATPVVI